MKFGVDTKISPPSVRTSAICRRSTRGRPSVARLRLHVAVLAAAFRPQSVGTLLAASVGGYALAWAAGLIAIVLAAGAGARDLTLVLALGAVLPTNPAVAVAVVSRAVTTVCDLALAGVAGIGVATLLRQHTADDGSFVPAGRSMNDCAAVVPPGEGARPAP